MNEDIFHLGVKGLIENSNNELLLLKVNIDNLKGYNGATDVESQKMQKLS
jgi:hypothetical protein